MNILKFIMKIMKISPRKKTDYEIYHLLIDDKDYPFTVLKKIAFETQQNKALVEFDYNIAYKYEDDPNEYVLGFFHTHPTGMNHMSATDDATMEAWIKCLGRELLCVIDSGTSIDGWLCFINQRGEFDTSLKVDLFNLDPKRCRRLQNLDFSAAAAKPKTKIIGVDMFFKTKKP